MEQLKVYGFEMARISEVYLSTLSNIMKPYGINRYFTALVHLCENSGKWSQKDLALALRKDKVSTMRMVDYLSDKELLVRKQDIQDRRCQLLEVTEKAMALLPILKSAIAQTNDLLLKDFSAEEKDHFQSSMNKLYTTIGNMPEPEFIVKAHKRKHKENEDIRST
jgi:DNA-binding MarR family transcriptional regulator